MRPIEYYCAFALLQLIVTRTATPTSFLGIKKHVFGIFHMSNLAVALRIPALIEIFPLRARIPIFLAGAVWLTFTLVWFLITPKTGNLLPSILKVVLGNEANKKPLHVGEQSVEERPDAKGPE